jgi:cyclic beta-1,2-glucan synthetase
VSITLPSATASRFTRLFTDARGTDPYCEAVSDVYQDLFGEAIYHGKAIYDVRAFHKILNGRFPQQRLLSHDLIEGTYAGVGLATDVETLRTVPVRLRATVNGNIDGSAETGRSLLDLPRVPAHPAGARAESLTPINRWKILTTCATA